MLLAVAEEMPGNGDVSRRLLREAAFKSGNQYARAAARGMGR